MKRMGFTLIEVLVASLLMSMLVTILTMVFSQSSIAWRTGKASVAQMDSTRRRLSLVQRQADDLLPGIRANDDSTFGRVMGPWNNEAWKGNRSQLRKRAVEQLGLGSTDIGSVNETANKGWFKLSANFKDNGLGKSSAYVVGVRSLGPDGKQGTEDDITTWPDDWN